MGDRLDTDIEGANRVDADSLLVLTGVSHPADVVLAPPQRRPSYVAADLTGLLEPHPLPSGGQGQPLQMRRLAGTLAHGNVALAMVALAMVALAMVALAMVALAMVALAMVALAMVALAMVAPAMAGILLVIKVLMVMPGMAPGSN